MELLHSSLPGDMRRKAAGGEGDGWMDFGQALKGHAYGLGLFQNAQGVEKAQHMSTFP